MRDEPVESKELRCESIHHESLPHLRLWVMTSQEGAREGETQDQVAASLSSQFRERGRKMKTPTESWAQQKLCTDCAAAGKNQSKKNENFFILNLF